MHSASEDLYRFVLLFFSQFFPHFFFGLQPVTGLCRQPEEISESNKIPFVARNRPFQQEHSPRKGKNENTFAQLPLALVAGRQSVEMTEITQNNGLKIAETTENSDNDRRMRAGRM